MITDTDPHHQTLDTALLLTALTALKKGDFSVRLPASWTGIGGKIADTLNEVIELNEKMASELERVSLAVGKEGKINHRVSLGGVGGSWRTLEESFNTLIDDLVRPTSEMARVIGAVANGDLSQMMSLEVDGRPLEGQFLRTAKTVNTMVDQLNSFASEVTRVAREVGTEGKLGGQAEVKGVAGTWKDLTDNVNLMAGNLTGQVRNIAAVTTAVAYGDLSKKITVDVKGEILDLKNTINTMVDQLNSFASEVTRVAREVGTEGKLGGQAEVKGVAGTWKDLTDNVNLMAANLTGQVRNIAAVTTAVANGDLSKKITVDVKGEILDLKNTVNTMVDQLNSFASEVTRVAKEVGTEGKLGGQAEVKGVAGTWKDLTDNVNLMAANLTGQVRNIAEVTTAVAKGDLSKKITVDVRGEILELKDTINTMVDQLRSFASEVTRVAKEVGTEGKLGGQAYVPGVAGTWKDLTDNVNLMAGNLTGQVRNIAEVTTAVAYGDLSKKITVDVKGEILDLKNTINTMVDQLNSFASEVTRVAREVGTEGKLGGQAEVKGVAGTWKDLTDNVNLMAGNLTGQVRGIAKVVTGVANGDLKQKLTVDAKGEIAALADTINAMIDTLATFADQVTTVAREVGVEGKLGGQASVPGAAGTWKDLTDNVNQLAANLTTQVRAIAEVATAVTKGDLTRSIRVDARGEVAVLKDNINEMIRNLRDTTQKNSQQDWLKSNLAKFTRMLQGQKDLLAVSKLILSELAPLISAQHGVFYLMDASAKDEPVLKLLASYAYRERKSLGNQFRLGEGLVGQCALEKDRIVVTDVPDDYVQINSGLGAAAPRNIIVLPVLFEGHVKAVIELASFQDFSPTHETFLDQLTESIGIVLNTIEANMRTEELLKQSQSLARELQSRQEELQQTNAQLEEKATLLADQNAEVERKNREVEQAKVALEEKATQLALTSKYKSEFLANMSHELRTPLNSLLILAHQLSENPEGNLSNRQVEYAKTIHGAGTDLMVLINDILDLSKIESGTVTVDVEEVYVSDLREYVERTFRHVAESRKLAFQIDMGPGLPRSVSTDSKRLHQVIKNLLSNAFKFTERGRVALKVARAEQGWSADHDILNRAESVVAFSVTDTGIGIPPDKQKLIFEAFQQADGTTSRKYGGTGLGLSISREIARLLGGEIRLQSVPDVGSTFTLYLPVRRPQGPVIRALPAADGEAGAAEEPVHAAEIVDERPAGSLDDYEDIRPGDRAVLIVGAEPSTAAAILERVRRRGCKGVVAVRGDTAIALARRFRPATVVLDERLPDVKGLWVLETLKADEEMRHTPVHILSSDEGVRERAAALGAASFRLKPIEGEALDELAHEASDPPPRPARRVLVVHEDDDRRAKLLEAIEGKDLEILAAGSGEQALGMLKQGPVDCVVIRHPLPDMSGPRLARELAKLDSCKNLPVVLVGRRPSAKREVAEMERAGKSLTLRTAVTMKAARDELDALLRPAALASGKPRRKGAADAGDENAALAGKRVLVVDDDLRNIFALTSLLERHKMDVRFAENGKAAIESLKSEPGIDIVLMDVMMPEMDGYDTMRAIRADDQFRRLPIVALTARAMKGDREKCIEAGASDYIPKPVVPDQLLALLRVWFTK